MYPSVWQQPPVELDPSVLKHLVDVHCHPTDSSPIPPDDIESLGMTICAMASRRSDQHLVRELALANPAKVIPCFGYHPWFSHHISLGKNVSKDDHYRRLLLPNGDQSKSIGKKGKDSSALADQLAAFEKLLPLLPEPTPLDEILSELRTNFEAFPNAMLGEIGLDRSFHIPYDYHAEPREMTPFTVPIEHQIAIVEAQIQVAVDYRRNISFHTVKANQLLLELLHRMETKHQGRWTRINIDLHSCGISVESVRDVQRRHQNVYISFSTAINGRSSNHRRLIDVTDPRRLLVESDYHNISMCVPQTWAMVNTVARVKRWPIELKWLDTVPTKQEDWGVVRRLEQNWLRFSTREDPYETEY